MKTTDRYKMIVQEQQDSQDTLTAAKKNLNKFVIRKIDYLSLVGSDVMNKVLGTHGHDQTWKNNEAVGHDDLEWFKYWGDKQKTITRIDENYIYFKSPLFSTNRQARELTISTKYLQLSDRDFAKIIRQKVALRKSYVKLYTAINAITIIKEKQEEIEKLQEEIKAISKVSENIDKIKQNYNEAQKTEQRTRFEFHQRL